MKISSINSRKLNELHNAMASNTEKTVESIAAAERSKLAVDQAKVRVEEATRAIKNGAETQRLKEDTPT